MGNLRSVTSSSLMCVLWLLASHAWAQSNTTGSIYGVVRTGDGQPIEGARVMVTSVQTGISRNSTTRSDGNYRITALPVGTYTIRIEADGHLPAEHQAVTVKVGTGTPAHAELSPAGPDVVNLAPLEVVGGRVSAIDVSSPESTTVFTFQDIDRLPVVREREAVALLAPGTVDNPLFGLTFGGASAGENGYFINGMDVTDFRNGLGGSTVPFEFFSEFQVKTGGYGAEFGRSTGGVVNAVTRRGGDRWQFGGGAFFEPDSLSETRPDSPYPPGTLNRPDYFRYNSGDEQDVLDTHLYLSGPIVDGHLYMYAIVNQRFEEGVDDLGPASFQGADQLAVDEWDWDDTFWGLKLDWEISPRHLLELTAFRDGADRATDNFQFNLLSGELERLGTGFALTSGETYSLRYTGWLGSDWTLSALAGHSKYDRTFVSDADDNPVVIDTRSSSTNPFPAGALNLFVGTAEDERDMLRLDVDWDLGARHRIRAGVDYLRNRSFDSETYSGGVYWAYFDVMPGEVFQGVIIPEGVTQAVRERINQRGGNFEVENTAFYIENHWQLTDDWLLYLGLRNETFDNKNSEGRTFVEMDDQLAPRLGFSWDVAGDGRAKVYGTAGRYHLPMPTVVNINLAGGQLFTEEWLALEGLNADGTPIKGDSFAFITRSDGSIPDTATLIDARLDPTYQDEFILGFEYEWRSGLVVGARAIYRDLKEVIEDVDTSRALNAYAAENGYEDCCISFPFQFWFVLTNPGRDMHVSFDLDGDGVNEQIVLPAGSLGLDRPRRTYKALELLFEKAWNDRWFLQGSYTWAENEGNYEGWTNTSTEQANGPLMSTYDLPELMENADGRLAGDRPHTVKLFGAWRFAEHWQLSGNFLFQSGMPRSSLGTHPNLPTFLNEAYYNRGVPVRRGYWGRNSDITRLDLGLQFDRPVNWRDGRLKIRLDVFNVLNEDTVTRRAEYSVRSNGLDNPGFELASDYQRSRFVRLAARLDF